MDTMKRYQHIFIACVIIIFVSATMVITYHFKTLVVQQQNVEKNQSVQVKSATDIEREAFTNPYYKFKKSLYENDVVVNTPKQKIVFLGDSISDFANWSEIFLDKDVAIYNRGISGDTINGVRARVDAVKRISPDKIFLMIGINNLACSYTVAETTDAYRVLINELTSTMPKTQIYIQSVLPINNTIYKNEHIPDNDNIVKLNRQIVKIANEYHLEYIDLYSAMLGADGRLISDYTLDGCHLNSKGYAVWKSYIFDKF